MSFIYGNVFTTFNTGSPSTIDTSGTSATWVAPNQILFRRSGAAQPATAPGPVVLRKLSNVPKIDGPDEEEYLDGI